jgi:hypothetical protein
VWTAPTLPHRSATGCSRTRSHSAQRHGAKRAGRRCLPLFWTCSEQGREPRGIGDMAFLAGVTSGRFGNQLKNVRNQNVAGALIAWTALNAPQPLTLIGPPRAPLGRAGLFFAPSVVAGF